MLPSSLSDQIFGVFGDLERPERLEFEADSYWEKPRKKRKKRKRFGLRTEPLLLSVTQARVSKMTELD